ncbi:MAG: cell division protein FtsL [Acidobacteria bacterium]|nr:cell division protein FtsL [Acidobacteriota bacterium]
MKRLPLNQPNFTIHRERDRRALSRLALLLFSGLLLAGGFVFAAGQHFAAVRYGYQSEQLRRERERLVEEQRRLLLEREEASAPARLEGEARKLGLQPVSPGQVGRAGTVPGSLPPTAAAMAAPSAALNR